MKYSFLHIIKLIVAFIAIVFFAVYSQNFGESIGSEQFVFSDSSFTQDSTINFTLSKQSHPLRKEFPNPENEEKEEKEEEEDKEEEESKTEDSKVQSDSPLVLLYSLQDRNSIHWSLDEDVLIKFEKITSPPPELIG